MTSSAVDPNDPAWGTIALTTLVDTPDTTVTYRLSSIANAWYHAILDFWDDVSEQSIQSENSLFVLFFY